MPDDPKPPEYSISDDFKFTPEAIDYAYHVLATRLNAVLDLLHKTQRYDLFLLECSICLAYAHEIMSQMNDKAQERVIEAAKFIESHLTKVPRDQESKIITLPGILGPKKKGN